jgi:chromosome segregation ATPase
MECDKVRSEWHKELNNHIPKLERNINTIKEKYDFLSDDITQKTSKMQADVNILKEGLNFEKSSSISQFRSVRERLDHKFGIFEKHMTECKDTDKDILKRIAQLEHDIKENKENPRVIDQQIDTIDEEQINGIMEKLKYELEQKLVSLIYYNCVLGCG